MTRVALDSNILIYAELEPDSEKGKRSIDLIVRSAADGVIAVQVLGEYLRFIQRRVPSRFEGAIRQAALYRATFVIPPTTDIVLDEASELARVHRLQLWDCVVCAASGQAGARALLTEDMQDGRVFNGVRLVNPFVLANANIIEALYSG